MGAMWRSSIPNSVIDRIVAHVNRKAWWHVPSQDPMAYSKRGQILRIEFCRGGVLWPTARLWNVEDVFEERPVKAVLWAPPRRRTISAASRNLPIVRLFATPDLNRQRKRTTRNVLANR